MDRPLWRINMQLFLDCDGVLADFDSHAHSCFNMPSREYEKLHGEEKFWKELEEEGNFFSSMPLMPDANQLVEATKHLKPIILTGCPRGDWAKGQKVEWANKHFPDLDIITCKSSEKRNYAKPGDIIIDDYPKYRHLWLEMGGIWISHYDAQTSLKALWTYVKKA